MIAWPQGQKLLLDFFFLFGHFIFFTIIGNKIKDKNMSVNDRKKTVGVKKNAIWFDIMCSS